MLSDQLCDSCSVLLASFWTRAIEPGRKGKAHHSWKYNLLVGAVKKHVVMRDELLFARHTNNHVSKTLTHIYELMRRHG